MTRTPARTTLPYAALLPEMLRLWDGGRFREAAALFDAAPRAATAASEAAILRARAYLKSDDAPEAIKVLARATTTKKSVAIERDTILASAHAWVGDYRTADSLFDRAMAVSQRLGDADLQSDIAYYRAQRYLFERRPEAARELLGEARASATESRQLRALHLESFILNYEGRQRDQALVLITLLRRIDPYQSDHMEIRAWATEALAALGRELYVRDALPEVERQLGGVAWPSDFDDRRFQALRALGWARALRGDYFNAFRHLKLSSQIATADAWRAIAAAERAELARCTGEQLWSRQELAEAEEYAAKVDWKAVRDESFLGLLLLAELFVPVDVSKASYYQARFHESRDIKAPNFYLRDDARLAALAQYSLGIVDLAVGHRRAGRDLLKQALNTFRQHQYDWRAGRCALRLHEELGDAGYASQAAEHLRNYMSSWLGDELRALQPSDGRLTPTQQRVYQMLRSAASTDDIVQQLGRSRYTVRNHIKAVLKAMGVRSRVALVARATESRSDGRRRRRCTAR